MSILEEIEESIGRPATIALTRVYGGRTLRVPSSIHTAHPIAIAVGMDAAAKLCREFNGMALEIPSERSSLLRARNEAIVAAYLHPVEPASIRRLAMDHQVSRKMIRKILAKHGVPLRGADYGERSHFTPEEADR